MFLHVISKFSLLDIQLSAPRPHACLDRSTNVPKPPLRIINVFTHLRTVKSCFSCAPTPGPRIYSRLKGRLRFPVGDHDKRAGVFESAIISRLGDGAFATNK